MSSKYAFDSYAWAEYFDGTKKGLRVKEMLEKNEIVTSVIALAELSDKYARENREFEPFLEFIQGKAKIIPLHQSIAVEAGKLKKELREIEKNVSLADAIHFQTAKSVGAVFVTGDPDFKLVDGILFLG